MLALGVIYIFAIIPAFETLANFSNSIVQKGAYNFN